MSHSHRRRLWNARTSCWPSRSCFMHIPSASNMMPHYSTTNSQASHPLETLRDRVFFVEEDITFSKDLIWSIINLWFPFAGCTSWRSWMQLSVWLFVMSHVPSRRNVISNHEVCSLSSAFNHFNESSLHWTYFHIVCSCSYRRTLGRTVQCYGPRV